PGTVTRAGWPSFADLLRTQDERDAAPRGVPFTVPLARAPLQPARGAPYHRPDSGVPLAVQQVSVSSRRPPGRRRAARGTAYSRSMPETHLPMIRRLASCAALLLLALVLLGG